MDPIPTSVLDAVLSLQLTVAWAGEGRSEPRRLGWWDTDLIDPAGGGDFFTRLAPKTHPWAAIEAARHAARLVDVAARKKMADPDAVRTLYFLGFELDEALTDRLAALKRELRPPHQALPLPLDLGASFAKDALERSLTGHEGPTAFSVVPGGRQLAGSPPAEADVMVKRLASALLPFTGAYPLPFYRVKR